MALWVYLLMVEAMSQSWVVIWEAPTDPLNCEDIFLAEKQHTDDLVNDYFICMNKNGLLNFTQNVAWYWSECVMLA